MAEANKDTPPAALATLELLRHCFGDNLAGVYLYGSAVAGGLHPHSDLDLLAVVREPIAAGAVPKLLTGLLALSGRYPIAADGRRPIELTVFSTRSLEAGAFPIAAEFVYGEWLRDGFAAGKLPQPEANPDFALLIAQARQTSVPLCGPPPAELLPLVPFAEIRRAIEFSLPALLDWLEGDERNVLLTLARMWRTLSIGEFVAKDMAADWAMRQLPAAQALLLAEARAAYLGLKEDVWGAPPGETAALAGQLAERVRALL